MEPYFHLEVFIRLRRHKTRTGNLRPLDSAFYAQCPLDIRRQYIVSYDKIPEVQSTA
jgi:hypothetical protein